jgi:trigger factor
VKVRIEDAGPCRKVMHVDAPAELLAPDYQDIVKMFAKMAEVPGFRLGRAPLNVVERNYAKHIEEQAKERLVPSYYRQALREKEIVPVAIVEVRDVVFNKADGLAFNVTVDVAPEFKLPKYKKIPLKRAEVNITDKDVDDAQNRLLASLARYEDVSGRNVKKDDLVKIDYRGTLDGAPLANIVKESQGVCEGNDFWVLAGEPDFLPGFVAGLLGAAIGETKEINVHFPEDFRLAVVAGKNAVYSVVIKGVREKILPKLDADILRKAGVETETALRQRLREEMRTAGERREKDRLTDEIAKVLLENTSFDLPQSIVAQETNLALRSILQRIAMQGATETQIDAQKDEILQAATRSSVERVKLSYILSRIADEEKINVEESEIDAHVESMAKRYGVSPERLRADLEKANGMERLRSDIRADKTLSFLLENAKIKN